MRLPVILISDGSVVGEAEAEEEAVLVVASTVERDPGDIVNVYASHTPEGWLADVHVVEPGGGPPAPTVLKLQD